MEGRFPTALSPYTHPAMTKLTKKAKATFDDIKRTDENGQEWWSSRDLAKALDYANYRRFLEVMRKAWKACYNSGVNPYDHFVVSDEMVQIGSNAERQIDSIKLSRYACYLSVQNADSTKTIVAQAQTYFAMQTRRAELLLDEPFTEEEQKRLLLRGEMKTHNKRLASAARGAGVLSNKDYGIFQNAGYKGLYGGLDKQDIHRLKGLTRTQDILDHMGSTELAANLFRATQTEEKLRRESIQGREAANRAHFEVGAKVRQTIRELNGTMPEDLPATDSVRKLEARQKRLESKKSNDKD